MFSVLFMSHRLLLIPLPMFQYYLYSSHRLLPIPMFSFLFMSHRLLLSLNIFMVAIMVNLEKAIDGLDIPRGEDGLTRPGRYT